MKGGCCKFKLLDLSRSHALRGNVLYLALCAFNRVDAERPAELVPTRSIGTRVQLLSVLNLKQSDPQGPKGRSFLSEAYLRRYIPSCVREKGKGNLNRLDMTSMAVL